MITSRWLSAVSFNSYDFLKEQLDDLINRNIISFYYFIFHRKENDDKKNHYHVFLIPNGRLNTDSLRDYFDETDYNSSIPIRILPFRYVTKFADKYLYDLHDKNYLASKYLVKKYHYKRKDFITSDETYFSELIDEIDYSKYMGLERFKNAVLNGCSFEKCVYDGIVPMQQYSAYKSFYNDIHEYYQQKNSNCVLRAELGGNTDFDSQ